MATTDKELLELAAKAAGFIEFTWNFEPRARQQNGVAGYWNPLKEFDQAKELRHTLRMKVFRDNQHAYVIYALDDRPLNTVQQSIAEAGGKKAATRRAIVRAAAEIGRASTTQASEKL